MQGPDIHSRRVRVYRWIVFALAAFYSVYNLVMADYSNFGGPFRFLTLWALFLSFFAASRMLALTERRSARRHEVTAMCAAVINAMVVFLYWKLFFIDPKLVNGGNEIVWWQEYYLHALGPALQIIDALFIGRVFRRVWRAVVPLMAVIGAYVAWAELVLQRFSDSPAGSVTSGLPYPFLNDMAWSDRVVFYFSNALVAMAILLGFAVVAWVFGRFTSARSTAGA